MLVGVQCLFRSNNSVLFPVSPSLGTLAPTEIVTRGISRYPGEVQESQEPPNTNACWACVCARRLGHDLYRGEGFPSTQCLWVIFCLLFHPGSCASIPQRFLSVSLRAWVSLRRILNCLCEVSALLESSPYRDSLITRHKDIHTRES